MATCIKSHGAGRNQRRSLSYVQRMERVAKLVRATFAPWEAIPVDVRRVLLGVVVVVGLELVGLSGWITQVIG
ncbi:MAG TPA: hypothetical protein VGJ86_08090 [Acidimicrobiales bacterium]